MVNKNKNKLDGLYERKKEIEMEYMKAMDIFPQDSIKIEKLWKEYHEILDMMDDVCVESGEFGKKEKKLIHKVRLCEHCSDDKILHIGVLCNKCMNWMFQTGRYGSNIKTLDYYCKVCDIIIQIKLEVSDGV